MRFTGYWGVWTTVMAAGVVVFVIGLRLLLVADQPLGWPGGFIDFATAMLTIAAGMATLFVAIFALARTESGRKRR